MMSEQEHPLRVRYVHEKPGVHTGNILWPGAWPMKWGIFPANHPCALHCIMPVHTDQFGESNALTAFRQRGYWASCFPEGDGITMLCRNGQTPEQVMADIRECFGWTVTT
jgi:hypothetical protein